MRALVAAALATAALQVGAVTAAAAGARGDTDARTETGSGTATDTDTETDTDAETETDTDTDTDTDTETDTETETGTPTDAQAEREAGALRIAHHEAGGSAAPAWHGESRTNRVRLLHAAITVGIGALYATTELVWKREVTPDACRWCTPPSLDVRVRNALRWSDGQAADSASNGTAFIAAPLLATSALVFSTMGDASLRRWFDDLLPVAEAAVTTSVLAQIVKASVGRQRPFAHFGTAAVQPADDVNMSFYSGHTMIAANVTASAGTVALLRGYRIAPLIWAAGGALAVASGYLRVAADAHYFTDVTTGLLVGAGIGVAVPLLLHRDVLTSERPRVPRLALSPTGPAATPGLTLSGWL